VILTPLMTRRANAHAERWIGSCRRECFDWMPIANERHLETPFSNRTPARLLNANVELWGVCRSPANRIREFVAPTAWVSVQRR
jgi:hypothetical protein